MATDFSDEDREDLERLIGGRGDDVCSPRLRGLADVLRAAAAPARPHELRGEDDAVAAFRVARSGSSAAARRARICLPAVKVAAVVAVAITLGSAAAGMAAGVVPNPLVDFGLPLLPHSSTAVSSPSASASDGVRSLSAAATPSASVPGGTSVPVPPAGGLPVPSLPSLATGASWSVADLCTWYRALGESQRPWALAEPVFAPLVTIAGGAASVDAYCDRVQESPSASPALTPTPTPTPTPAPSPSPTPSPSSPSPSPSPSSPPPPLPSEAATVEATSTATRTVPDRNPKGSRQPPGPGAI